MSSDDEFHAGGAKKRRIVRACDKCRSKKVKCDGATMPNNRCSNCITNKHDCTYVETAKKRGPPKGYVEGLENRLEKMEKLLGKLCPDTDFSQELGGILTKANWAAEHSGQTRPPGPAQSSFTRHRESSSSSGYGYPGLDDGVMSSMTSPTAHEDIMRAHAPGKCPTGMGITGTARHQPAAVRSPDSEGRRNTRQSGVSVFQSTESTNTQETAFLIDDEAPMVLIEDLSSSDDDFVELNLTKNMKNMNINPQHNRFFGKSSGVVLIQTALDLRNQYTGKGPVGLKEPLLGNKRKEFWDVRPWEQIDPTAVPGPRYEFPEPDLIADLIELYFIHVNLFTPLLHRPTFDRLVVNGTHFTDNDFASVLLLVLCVGSRYSDDERVFLEGVNNTHTCGWKWFNQVQVVKKSLLAAPCLYDLQFYCLSVMFLQGSSAPQACWTMTGIGIRLAQDVGAHRRKVYSTRLTPEDELWKRAFWTLVSIDRGASCALGRPPAISDEDFDLDMCVEVDDEYWEHEDPEKAFIQPPGKPSTVAYFNCHLRLNQVLAFALRTIYSINKSKVLLGFVGQQWEQHIVAELDSALNKWIDLVPDHLRWDPNREDALWAEQSASLYGAYYHLQILIHRPFIPSPRKPSLLSFPSLAICTNAARSCSHVYDVTARARARKRPFPNSHLRYRPQDQVAVFTSGVVLLLNIWGGKRSGLQIDPLKEMADVYKCMDVLKRCEGRWHSSGKLWDILYELASVGDLPLPEQTSPPTAKRARDDDGPHTASSPTSSSSSGSNPPAAPRHIAGSRRVSLKDHARTTPPVTSSFTLPVYSEELGRIPLHNNPQFTSSNVAPTNNDAWFYTSAWDGSDPTAPNTVSSSSFNGFPDINGSDGYPVVDMSFFNEFPAMENPQTLGHAQQQQQQQQLPNQYSQEQQHSFPQQQQQPQQQYGQQFNDTTDTMSSMWSNAPAGFEMDDWGSYINNLPTTYMTGPIQ